MPSVYPYQQNFLGGVIGTSLYGNVNTAVYQNGLLDGFNWTIQPQGGLLKRPGFRRVVDITSEKARIFTFSRARGMDVVVIVDEDDIVLYTEDGQVTGTLTENQVTDPDFRSGMSEWDYRTSYAVPGFPAASYAVRPEKGQGVIMRNGLFGDVQTNTYLAGVGQEIFTEDPTVQHTLSFKIEMTSTSAKGVEFDYDIFDEKGGSVIAGGTVTTIPDDGPWEEIVSFDFTPGVGEDNYYLQLKFDNPGEPPFPAPTSAQNGDFLISDIDIRFTSTPTPVSFTSPWSKSQLDDIQIAMDSARGWMIFCHPNVAPHVLVFDGVNNWEFQDMSAAGSYQLTNTPAEWTGTNWPSCPAYFQGRLWLAATPDEPSTIWASRTGDYLDFNTDSGGTPTPVSALEFELATSSEIQWIAARKQMIIGTDRDEWLCSSPTGIITFEAYKFSVESSHGCGRVQPVPASEQLVYVNASQEKALAINDWEQVRGWETTDLNIINEEIMYSRVKRIGYAKDPYYQLHCLMYDGSISVCTYDRKLGLTAWMRWASPRGTWEDITVTEDELGSSLWVVVDRGDDVIIGYFDPTEPRAPLDDYVEASKTSGTPDTITGLPYSDGVTVSVVGVKPVTLIFPDNYVNGVFNVQNYIGDFTVTSGTIELPDGTEELEFLVGFKYNAQVVTPTIEAGNPAGTAEATKRRMNRFYCRIFNSALPLVNGVQASRYDDTSISGPPYGLGSTYTGDVEVRHLGWEQRGSFTIAYPDPVNCNILSIFGKLGANTT